MNSLAPYALFAVYICIWSFLPITAIGPGLYFLLLATSLLLGFWLIVMQVDKDTGDDGRAITMLSNEVIPEVRITPETAQEDQKALEQVNIGKMIFLPLASLVLVFWVRLTVHGLPAEWANKGYSLLIYLFAYGEAGKDYTHLSQNFSSGDYLSAAQSAVNMGFDFSYIRWPSLISVPYTGFIIWAMSGRDPDANSN